MKLNVADNAWPPGGWAYFDPKTGYRESKPTEHDRREAATAIMQMRKNNPHIYKGDSLTYQSALNALEDYTARRLLNKGLTQFISQAPQPVPVNPLTQGIKKKLIRSVARPEVANPAVNNPHGGWRDKIRKLSSGAATLVDWLGNGQKPVDQETAERRAKVCSVCPLNQQGGFLSSITTSIADAIRSQSELRNQLNLSTSLDSSLHTCMACECVLTLKVWVPSETILNHTSKEVMLELDKDCWIPKEA